MRHRLAGVDGALVAVAAAALAIRVGYTLGLGQYVELGLTDARFYSTSANALADGQGYIDVFRSIEVGAAMPTAHHPPGWPALLSVFAFMGVDSELGQRLVGCVVGALVVVAIGLVGRRFGGRTVGLIAAGLAAVHPTLVAADGSLMSETLSGLLTLGVVLAGLRVVDRPSAARALVLGVVIGGTALVRGEAFAYAALLVLPLALWGARRPTGGLPAAARIGGLALLGMAAVVLPWTARNFVRLDGFALISTNESTVLAGANCDGTYYGPKVGSWLFDCLQRDPSTTAEVAQAAIWRRQGLDYASDHLSRLPVVVGARVFRTMGFGGGRHPLPEGRHEQVQVVGNVVWLTVLLPLGTIGGVLVARRRARIELVVLLAPVGAALLVTAVGFGMVRFRHSMELMAVVLAAVAITAATRLGQRNRGR